MPPKRPPPLPPSLFTGNGPLSAGAQLREQPMALKIDDFVIDAHTRGEAVVLTGAPPVKGSIVVVKGGQAGPNSKTVVPASINLDDDKLGDEDTPLPGGIDLSSDTHVDLLIEHPSFLSDKHWANLEKIIDKIDGGLKKVEAQYSANGDVKRKIVISGLLPPPFSSSLTPLLQQPTYDSYNDRLGGLSLHPDVVLKALPPVGEVAGGEPWWEDQDELKRVCGMFLNVGIEAFGFGRIVFGSSPAVTVAEKGVQLLSGPQWYQLVKDTLGGDPVATNKVMGANAKELYGLE